jgi:hypothetical protein
MMINYRLRLFKQGYYFSDGFFKNTYACSRGKIFRLIQIQVSLFFKQ